MVYVERNKDREIQYQYLNPHYTDSTFLHAQTVYLETGLMVRKESHGEFVDGAHYVYSDNLASWHKSEDRDAAWEKAQAEGHQKNSAGILESYLRHLMGDPELRLVHILTGHNWANGYPYRVYGIIQSKKEEALEEV